MTAATFAAVLVTLLVAHHVADHWVQTERQAADKGRSGWPGRWAAARHVATLTVTAALALAVVAWRLGLQLDPGRVALGLALNAVTHWWADRRSTLRWLAVTVGHRPFHELGSGGLGGAYVLDQAWHWAWLLVAALVIV
jgi:hypothetical protein